MGSAVPYRIDLFDDEIDSIRTFDPDTQRSLFPVPEVRLLPGREFPLDEQARTQFRTRWRELFSGDPNRCRIYKDMAQGITTGGIEYYLPLFFEQTATIFDYLKPVARSGTTPSQPSTMLVLTVGTGVHGFTLDPVMGEFMLTHPAMRVPEDTQEFAINASNARFWEAPVKRYVDECLAGRTGVRGKDFNMRWIASMVAEAHRILMRGGVFMYPRDTKDASKPGRLRLLYEANPVGWIMEQAGGRASTGREPMLNVKPSSLHQRIGLVFGSKNEVERIEKYHSEPATREIDNPLFAERTLFRA
jgi:hypothetical protein